jgi:soluble lytic murein transglycosylase
MVASVINIESSYDENAISKANARGLMQLLPSTAFDCAKRMGIVISEEDLFNEETNMMIGCFYLSYLLDLFDGDIVNTLSAYNWGLGNVRDWIALGNVNENGTIRNIPVKETKDYIQKYNVNYFVYGRIYKF